ncbi:lipoprotein (plasmid) [Legionella adelaidensis]|uniref:Lipoprotein n=1 Tax=Legionella adelaidensis TaxID=45056 RepID=A0A0W0R167_9GAMM|nr:penicillin-binding protein activator [Legionella adelaidensis]KTC64822.1 lipoprotein [Legionella adelaidensis]VEH86188.1 lipoprotein [Legionella adelaidensis]
MQLKSLISQLSILVVSILLLHNSVNAQEWQEPQDSPGWNPQSFTKLANSAPPKKIALLLPLSGPLEGPGNAVREGFLAAANKAKAKIGVQYYDTTNKNISEIYNQAIEEGAECIVGPLLKPEVNAIAQLPHPVPTLLLNEAPIVGQDNVFQFGLSLTLEAKQVASKAKADGHTNALVIVPTGVWGEEIAKSFQETWEQENGFVVDTLHYSQQDDLNNTIKTFLRVKASEEREKKIKQLLGLHIETQPRRRQDFDVIFLLAYPSKARQIMPMLKYYYAGDIPVYATSTVYAGNPNALRDKDLDGIIFCDMPWVFSNHTTTRNWPEQFNSYNRLYALGMDSYTLATQLSQLITYPEMELPRKSGVLGLNANQQITRRLMWGQFRAGNVKTV